jgi:hypothetical protein
MVFCAHAFVLCDVITNNTTLDLGEEKELCEFLVFYQFASLTCDKKIF